MYGKSKRGLGLTTILVLMFVINSFGFILYFLINDLSKLDVEIFNFMDNTTLVIYTLATMVNTIGAVGTWFFKVWGVYLVILTYIIIILVNAIDNFSINFVAISTLFIFLFMYLSRDIWKNEM